MKFVLFLFIFFFLLSHPSVTLAQSLDDVQFGREYGSEVVEEEIPAPERVEEEVVDPVQRPNLPTVDNSLPWEITVGLGVKNTVDFFLDPLRDLGDSVVSIVEDGVETVKDVGNSVIALGKEAFSLLNNLGDKLWNTTKSTFNDFVETSNKVDNYVFGKIQETASSFVKKIKEVNNTLDNNKHNKTPNPTQQLLFPGTPTLDFDFNIFDFLKGLFGNKEKEKPKQTPKKDPTAPRPISLPITDVIDNTRKDIDILPGGPDRLPFDKKMPITQFPNDHNVTVKSHINISAFDYAAPNKKPVYATMDGVVTINISKGSGENIWSETTEDENGRTVPKTYVDEDGRRFTSCSAIQKDYEMKTCGIWSEGLGVYAVLENNINKDEVYTATYAHLDKGTLTSLKVNESEGGSLSFKVKKGDLIGFTDNSGMSTGSHLHYEVKKNGKPFLSDRSVFEKCMSAASEKSDKAESDLMKANCTNDYNNANLELIGVL